MCGHEPLAAFRILMRSRGDNGFAPNCGHGTEIAPVPKPDPEEQRVWSALRPNPGHSERAGECLKAAFAQFLIDRQGCRTLRKVSFRK